MIAAHLVRKKMQRQKLRERDPWREQARANQLPPEGEWSTWLVMAGRGFGKTRTGAEFVREEVMSGRAARVALVGPTSADVRDVMVEGPSGLLAACQAYGFGATYEPSRRRVRFENGAVAFTYSAEEPDRLRGPQHDLAWADEVAAWKNPDAWDQLQFGLRLVGPLGHQPRQVATTTPKPVSVIRELRNSLGLVVTSGSTYENRANLAGKFFDFIVRKYEGTKLGQQELEGLLLEDVEGALWSWTVLDRTRVPALPPEVQKRGLRRIVLAIDPAVTYGPDSDETAMTVAGLAHDGEVYVLDHWSGQAPPDTWARKALQLYDLWRCDQLVWETNQGGELVRSTMRAAAESMRRSGERVGQPPPGRGVHAKRGKTLRAEPVSLLYEQGRVHHVLPPRDTGEAAGSPIRKLEDQMVLFPVANEDEDDRVDSLVYAVLELTGADRTARAA